MIMAEKTRKEKRHCFIIGCKGIPARYGGLETFVEKLTQYKMSSALCYHVARMGKKDFQYHYNEARCFNLAVPNIGSAKAIYYDLKALQWSIDYCRTHPHISAPIFYVLACRIGPFIRFFKKQIQDLGGVLYVNPDGHEWMRKKWGLLVRAYWRVSEALMVRHADLLICDSRNIEAYIKKTYARYGPKSIYIAYGADLDRSMLADDDPTLLEWYREKGLEKGRYYLVVGRFVPENSFDVMIREFMASDSERDLAIITTADERFLAKLRRQLHFERDERIRFVGSVYDQGLLKKIRENAYGYLHGHTVGGTNPSLIEAMSSTDLNLLRDVCFNREAGGEGALYWNGAPGDLAALINRADEMPKEERRALGRLARKRVAESYTWEMVCGKYERLFLEKGDTA